jgi:RNA polymerase primary sigma factor
MDNSKTHAIKDLEKSLYRYFGEIGNIPLLTPEEEIDLAVRIRQGDKNALTKLIKSNLRFVVRIAYEYRNQGLPLSDLINEGNLGLIKAAHRFDETKGFKFISYAVWWIRQSIMQALAEHARVVRLPLNRVSELNKIGKTFSILEQEYEREPTMDEVAGMLDISSSDVSLAMQYPGKQISLDASVSDGEKSSLLEVIENINLSPPDQPLTDESLKKEIGKALKSLTKKEAEVLTLYYGIGNDRPMTLEEIGKKFRLTRERVRQIKEKAIIRLRHQSRSKSLRQYLG